LWVKYYGEGYHLLHLPDVEEDEVQKQQLSILQHIENKFPITEQPQTDREHALEQEFAKVRDQQNALQQNLDKVLADLKVSQDKVQLLTEERSRVGKSPARYNRRRSQLNHHKRT